MIKVQLSIQEIVDDLYKIGEIEGYICGLADNELITEIEKEDYHKEMKTLMNKYFPKWENKIKDEYWKLDTEDEKGLYLSNELFKNIKHIVCQLI